MANVLKIARSFVNQYYKMMAESPHELHKFYKEQSDFIHPVPGAQDSNIHGVQAIMDHVAQLQLAGSRVDLTNGLIDAQQSEYDCVIVCVNGQITFPSSPASQAFVQSFVLAPQQVNANDTKKSYFVRNSIFRLVGGAVVSASPSAPATASSASTTVQPAVQQSQAPGFSRPVVPPVAVAPAEQNPAANTAKVQPPVAAEPPAVTEPPAAEETAVEKPVKEVLPPAPKEEKVPPAPPKPEGPKTYASILGVLSAPAAPEVKSAPAPAPAPVPTEKKVEYNKGVSNKDKKDRPNVPSLYINNIEETMTKDILFSLFSKFGGVGKIDLFAQKGYAFIEYKEAEGLKAALAAVKNQDPTFVVKGKRMGVEEKSGAKKDKQTQNGHANGQKKKFEGDKKQNKKEASA